MARRFSCPEETLAAEIELALAYVLACNPPAYEVLRLRRRELCEAMAEMLAERAAKGLSGMSLADDTPASARKSSTRA